MADSNDAGTKHEESNEERAFAFLRTNHRPAKPRKSGVTEIRGP